MNEHLYEMLVFCGNRQRANPKEVITCLWPDADQSHITFNPKVEKQYRRGQDGGGDGTALFILQDAAKVLAPFVEGTSYYLPDGPDGDMSKFGGVRYELGWLRIVRAYGPITFAGGESGFGERYRIRVPARAVLALLSPEGK